MLVKKLPKRLIDAIYFINSCYNPFITRVKIANFSNFESLINLIKRLKQTFITIK